MKIIYLFLLLIINLSMNAQSLTGIVYDLETNEPLFNAAIAINQGDQVISGMVTDSLGYFSRKLPAGKYILTCLYLGYESIVKEVLIRDKPVSINFAMEQKAYLSDNAVITARALREPNVTLISKEFFSRIPGAFSDPSRLTIKFPGISGASDQSNEIIVRGLAPHLSSWAINGAPVVNPNHLSNTGTITDVASASGGGVNMISGSSIKSYEFFNNPVNEDYNNVAGGLSNTTLEIPKGLQASLGVLGTEISYGTDKKDFNYGINYRYSTLGILSLIGVPLGDEKINFQDIHVRLYRKKGNRTYSNDFLMGSSSNIHESLGDKSVYYKDALFIKFEGFQIINSLTTGYKINNWESESTLNISAQSNFRFAENDTLIVPAIYPNSEDENQNIVFSMRNQMVYNYSKKIAWKTVIQNRYDLEQRFGRSWGYLQNSSSYLASGLKIRGDRFDLAVFPGISVQDYLVYGDFDDAQFELRASAIYKQKRNRLKLAYSRQSISNNY
ncbi:carboxypeptidase-like regulatory domain-containing protein, partial [Saprospiraceae bacterium]|nr:carboxypeptidase-like regulatory domain-containing protein [Saprospiraceae bacterium]